jgi:predicted ribosomally synthesized peptide with nif11-like leader
MSIAVALKFIQQIRGDPALNSRVEALGPASELEPLLQLARQAGFAFSEADLRQAFKHDWAMRWLRRGGIAQPARSEPDPEALNPP